MADRTIRLITVNTAPERAKRLIGRVVEDVRDKYTIVHVANVDSIGDVRSALEGNQPELLFTASMWTPDQAQEIVNIAQSAVPGIKTFSLPFGLQAEQGPDAVVEYIKEHLPLILDT
ncbi:hypothetical protein BD413DRAFT_473405 [Trametes elegans]|nr:hypothetical protein BD413DRAFT_473405 [Trametes elegans]